MNSYDTLVVINSDDEEEQERTSPTSPPDHVKGCPAGYKYQPKSPVYPPPSEGSNEEDFSSIPDLAMPPEEMSPTPDLLNDAGYEAQDVAPADVNADQDKDRQKTLTQALEDDLSKAHWQKESAKGPLEDLEKIALKLPSPFMMDSGMTGTRT